ncbi:MAG: SH3 domain-containing protein [Anaerolineae bacterium]
MKRFLIIPIVLLALAACQTPQPVPTATARPPTSTPTPPPTSTSSPTTAPTVAPTIAPTATPTTAPTAAPPATPTPGAADAYVNTADGLNLRAEANTAATLIRTLPLGTHLTTIGQPTAPDAKGIAWQNARTDDGQSGWVAAQFLTNTKPEPTTPAPSPTSATPSTPVVTPIAQAGFVYVASTGGLNLRADKSASAPLLATLANGQRLQTNGLGFGPDVNGITWLNVKTDDGIEGWVSAQFVTTQVPSVAPATPPANVSDAAAEILRRTNEFRQQNGVPPVILNDDLSRIALEHSQYMAQNGISHTGAGGLTAKQRIANAGYGAGRPTENIFGGEASIDDAWSYWATDPPHRDVLLNPFNNVVGIGVFKTGRSTYYTMDFGKPAE